MVVGSFIIGLDTDRPGIGQQIAEAAICYGVDNLNVLFLTPLPGTRLWDKMHAERRISLDIFPDDWKYYTLTFPVARYNHLSLDEAIQEMMSCNQHFYSLPRILRRASEQPMAMAQSAAYPGGQPLVPQQPPRGPQGLCKFQALHRAMTSRFWFVVAIHSRAPTAWRKNLHRSISGPGVVL